MDELRIIMTRFAQSGWELISTPANDWLHGEAEDDEVIKAIEQADKECGSCGCEFDPLYKRALELLKAVSTKL